MTQVTIEFDEFDLPDGTWFSVYGKADISGDVDRYGEIDGLKVEAIYLQIAGGKHVEIDDRHPMWRPILASFEHCCGARARDALIDDYVEDGGRLIGDYAEHSTYRAEAL